MCCQKSIAPASKPKKYSHFFTIGQMIIPGSCYWNMGIGREEKEVAGDEEGLKIMKTLGQNMAWLVRKINAK